MGLTPLEGLIMGTRCGDIDPAIIPFMMRKEGLDADGGDNLMNKQSGVYGMTGISSDFRDIEAAAAKGDQKAIDALDAYHTRVKKYIGSYAAEMNGVDAIELWNIARSAPPNPAKKELTIKLICLCLNRFTPIASAAISSSPRTSGILKSYLAISRLYSALFLQTAFALQNLQ